MMMMLSRPSHTRFVSTRGSFNGPRFCWPDGAPLLDLFVEQLNRALRFCNLDPALFISNSFRIGIATWAAAKVSETQIRQLGRWKSDAF